jgi:hypothetical protein
MKWWCSECSEIPKIFEACNKSMPDSCGIRWPSVASQESDWTKR